jgi:beta-lactamase regulating signal transducer with metallopeptidase domain
MANELLTALVHANLAAAVAVLAVLVLRGTVRRQVGAEIAYRLWACVPVAALTTLVPRPEAQWIVAPGVGPDLDPLYLAAVALSRAPAVPLLAVWLTGAVLMAGLTVVRQLKFLDLAARGLAGPAVVGVLAPRIVMPADAGARFTPDEQSIIRAHERTHIARRDPRTNALITLAQCLCWFNPLVHLAAREARIDQELACDATVVAGLRGGRRRYAETLLKTQLSTCNAPLGCHWATSRAHPLERRIAALRVTAPGARRRDLGAAAVLGAITIAGFSAWTAQAPSAAEGGPGLSIVSVIQDKPMQLLIIREPGR